MRLFCLVSMVVAVAVPTAQAAPAEPEARSSITVTVERTADGILARYTLPASVDRFTFANRHTIRDLWTVTTPGLTLSDDTVTGATPFDRFDVAIRPDAAEVDRIYMGLSRAGDGFVVYGPGLMAENTQTVLSIPAENGDVGLPAADAIGGYAYVGPADQITTDGRGAFVAGANVAAELTDPVRRAYFDSMAFYGERLGLDLTVQPVLIASVESPGPATFRGDVTDTGVISLRFKGDGWRGAQEQLAPFVWHETFHLWNGHGVTNRDAETAPWLHEGGADYAATVGAASAGDLTEAQARIRMAERLNGCRQVLAEHEATTERLADGNAIYNCGTLVQWLADLEARADGSGDVFTIWRDVLAQARADDTGYDVAAFRRRTRPDGILSILLDGPGTSRWDDLKARLTTLGVRLENAPSDNDLKTAALFHVAGRNCKGGSFGFYDDPGALKLDGANCGVLSGEPIIDTIESFNPQTESRAMFDAVQARCAVGLPIRYAARDGRTLEAVCDAPLVAPDAWAIVEAPPFALPDKTPRPL